MTSWEIVGIVVLVLIALWLVPILITLIVYIFVGIISAIVWTTDKIIKWLKGE